jgi:hypothetical protein
MEKTIEIVARHLGYIVVGMIGGGIIIAVVVGIKLLFGTIFKR